MRAIIYCAGDTTNRGDRNYPVDRVDTLTGPCELDPRMIWVVSRGWDQVCRRCYVATGANKICPTVKTNRLFLEDIEIRLMDHFKREFHLICFGY